MIRLQILILEANAQNGQAENTHVSEEILSSAVLQRGNAQCLLGRMIPRHSFLTVILAHSTSDSANHAPTRLTRQ